MAGILIIYQLQLTDNLTRTAGLEQEIETLKKRLAGCIREKQNLQEELSEAYHVKVWMFCVSFLCLNSVFDNFFFLVCIFCFQSQLADLHAAEVLKVPCQNIYALLNH